MGDSSTQSESLHKKSSFFYDVILVQFSMIESFFHIHISLPYQTARYDFAIYDVEVRQLYPFCKEEITFYSRLYAEHWDTLTS